MHTTQPIRKPFDDRKQKLNHHRRLARSIDSRIYSYSDRLYLVSRTPAYPKLLKAISAVDMKLNQHQLENIFRDIAFCGACDGELTAPILAKILNSLDEWEQRLSSLPGRKRTEIVIRQERDEIVRLRKRAKECVKHLKRPHHQSVFLFCRRQKGQVNTILSLHPNRKPTELERQLIDIVFWFSGAIGCVRFVDALFGSRAFESEPLQTIQRMIEWIKSLQRRVGVDKRCVLQSEFRNNKTFQRLIKWIKSVTLPWETTKGSLVAKLKCAINHLELCLLYTSDAADE